LALAQRPRPPQQQHGSAPHHLSGMLALDRSTIPMRPTRRHSDPKVGWEAPPPSADSFAVLWYTPLSDEVANALWVHDK